jgi:transcriptional regulator with XRE-family HTH domain
MSVHEKIRLVREAKGLTQEQAAEQLKMSVNGYGDIECGISDIKLSKLKEIIELIKK